MKYIALLIAIVGILPLSLLIRSNGVIATRSWFLLGLLPFLVPSVKAVDMTLMSWDGIWLGYVTGIDISLLDIFAIALFLASANRNDRINYHYPFIIYIFAILISILQAHRPTASIFYLWQFLKIYFLVAVVVRGAFDEAVSAQLLKGMAAGLLLQLFAVIWQRLGGQTIQPTGTFAHQNTLGLAAHMVVFPHMMLLLSGLRTLQYALTPIIGLLVAALTASRAALGFCVLGLGISFVVSFLRQWTAHKAKIAAAGLVGAALIAPVAYAALEQRFHAAPINEAEYDERAAFNRAAMLILDDNPLGVGANHYVYQAKNFGYSIRGGVVPFEGNLNNIVHNAYLLAASETGYFGAAAFVLLLCWPMLIALRYGWAARGTRLGDLLLGCAISLLVVSLHSFLEYIIFGKEVQYLFAILVGIIYASADRIRANSKFRSRVSS
jgi:O-antigen ligase